MIALESKTIDYEKVLRSLLQKAVRRGDKILAETVFKRLYIIGNKSWLRQRLAVISAEECWPICSRLEPDALDYRQLLRFLLIITGSCKDKSAAGLGSLGYELSNGDKSVLTGSKEDKHIKIIAAGVERPESFWPWAKAQCINKEQNCLADNAKYFFNKGGLPWDRAFFVAATYLSITNIQVPIDGPLAPAKNLPLWAAFDKHTKDGRLILKKVSSLAKLNFDTVKILNFYYESCNTNCSKKSYWWEREVHWRLAKYNLNPEEASVLWEKVKPLFLGEVLPYSILLQNYLEGKFLQQSAMHLN